MATALGLASLLAPIGGFVANIVFARTLGASGRGDLAAIIAALAVCEALLAFGLPDVLARHTSKDSLPAGAERSLALVAVAISLLPGVLISLYCHGRQFSWLVAACAGFVVPITTALVLARGVLVGRRMYRRLTASLILGGTCRLLAPLALLTVETPTENFALILVLVWTVAPAIPIFASRPFAVSLGPRRGARQIMREALGVWPATLAWQLNARLDQLVLAFFVSAADLGRYAVCVGIAEVPAFLASGPRQVILARVSKSHMFKGVPSFTFAILALGALVGVLSACFAGPLLIALFGPEFNSIALVLGILLVATGFDIGSGLLSSSLIAVGHGKAASVSQVAALVVTVIVLPAVIWMGGGIAAAATVRLAASASGYVFALSRIRIATHATTAAPSTNPGA